MNYLTIILFYACIICVNSWSQFVFTSPHSTNLDVIENWDGPWRLDDPCAAGATFNFDKYTRVAAFLDGTTKFSNMLLPDTTVFLFPEAGVVNVTLGPTSEYNKQECSSHENVLRYIGPEESLAWHDANNWKITEWDSALLYSTNHLLHCQKIPGQYDTVYFMSNKTYSININAPFQIKALTISTTVHTTETFYWDYIESIEGQLQFHLGDGMTFETESPLVIDDLGCDTVTEQGCTESNLDNLVMTELCSHISCEPVTSLPCMNPIKPKGHCCFLCGSMVTITNENVYYHYSVSVMSQYFNQIGNKETNQSKLTYDYSFIRLANDKTTHMAQYQLVVASTDGAFNQFAVRHIIYDLRMLIHFFGDGIMVGAEDRVPEEWIHSYSRTSVGQIVALTMGLLFLLLLVTVLFVFIYLRRNSDYLQSLIRRGRNTLLVSGSYKRADSDYDQDDTVHLSTSESVQESAQDAATVKMSDLKEEPVLQDSAGSSALVGVSDKIPLVEPTGTPPLYTPVKQKTQNFNEMSYSNPTYGLEEE